MTDRIPAPEVRKNLALAAQMRASGSSFAEIGERLKCDPDLVQRLLKQNRGLYQAAMKRPTLRALVEKYLLYRTVSAETAAWYRRAVSVYCGWSRDDGPLSKFRGDRISQFLLDMLAVGKSASYVRSLRGGLVALLHELRGDGAVERVRSVKIPPLEPSAWTAEEVSRLIAKCAGLPERDRWWWQVIIALAWYTGLDGCDLWRIERRHIRADGVLIFHRGKTGKRVISQLPLDLVALIDQQCPKTGPIAPRRTSKEYFRRTFKTLAKKAGLHGPFKRLRKSSGTSAERVSPGRGHEHLGNTRQIFEKHYQAMQLLELRPTAVEPLRAAGTA